MRWAQVHGAAWLGGIGFTMSLFVGGLAFADPEMVDRAKIGIFAASILAGLIGWLLVRRSTASPVAGRGAGARESPVLAVP
jgi:NhaA family Na+:H+ antiporter